MLRKLSLHGFKSFCDRTEITLGSGITAIVGPNGCGKSNLADALRWVLGEQNPRVLRSPKSQDVIFAGTSVRKAMGMAEVRLLLDSVGDEPETEILRRLARDGSGEYRLNGKICRWKDVIETLAGTGLSHTGYVVIGQGTIQELASGKPEDRRAWIEEASGVARVRLDKRDMESKLEAAKADIARLEDLLFELSARKEQLSGDREAARLYQELSRDRKALDLSMWLYQHDEETRKAATLERRVQKYKADLRDTELSIPRLTTEEESLVKKREPQDERVRESSVRREGAAKELLTLEKKRDAVRGRMVALRHEVEARTVRKAAISKDLKRLESERITLSERLGMVEIGYREAAAAVTSISEKRQSRESARKELGDKAIAVRTEIVGLTTELAATARSKEDLRRRLEDARRERVAHDERLAAATRDRDRLDKELATSLAAKEAAAKASFEAKSLEESLEKEVLDVRSRIEREISSEKNLGARLSAVKARRKLLEDMERSFEGYGKGPRSILEARQKGSLKGIEGAVGQLFSTESRYISALSAAVGGSAENIIVADESAAKAGIAHLKATASGRVTFLPLSILRPRGLSPQVEAALRRSKGVRPLLSVLSYPPEMEAAAKYLVGRIVLADTLDVGLAFMRDSGWGARVVTMMGDSIETGGAISGGEAPRSEALFRRKQELTEVVQSDKTLSLEMEGVLTRRRTLEKDLQALTAKAVEARLKSATIRDQVARLSETCTRQESLLRALTSEIKQREAETPVLSHREEGLSSDLGVSTSREEEIQAGLAVRQGILKDLEAKVLENLNTDRELENTARDLMSRKEQVERDLASVQRRIEGLLGEKTSQERSLAEEEKEIARQKALLQEASSEEKSTGEAIAVLEKEVAELALEVFAAQAERDELASRLQLIGTELERLSRDKVTLASRIDESVSEFEAARRSLEEIANLLAQEFGATDPAGLDHPRIARARGLPLTEELDDKMKALGGVNLKAEEEYDDVSERIDLITTEKADVLSAIEEVLKARELVEKEMETRFMETFQKVKSNFSGIFEELFGGGRGDLALVEDSLGVEVVAEPPGRRQKHLNLLSGGERSLCGIALIFAILSVKASPFIVLDEADTALDESNIVRYSRFLKRYSENTQFLVVTHQKATMEAADLLYGVTMEEPGVSKVFGMRLENR